MTDLRSTIVPKSDQLNADDLIGRTLTIRVSGVKLSGDADQPVCVHYDGDNGKPYKPCLSMRRVMIKVWGDQGAAFVGKRMTLYRDDKVTFGKDAVGGIRISHMSDIDREVTMALTATRANRKPYTVKPLAAAKVETVESVDLLTVLTKGRDAASKGSAALTEWWSRLDRDEKAAAKPTLDGELKAAATKADQAAFDDTEDQIPPHDPDTGEVDDSFPGDREPTGAGEAATSSRPEPESNDGPDVAADHLTPKAVAADWHAAVAAALPSMSADEIAAFLAKPDEQAAFGRLEEHQPALAHDLNKAITARRRDLAA